MSTVRVYAPNGEPFDVPQHKLSDIVLNKGFSQTAPVISGEPAVSAADLRKAADALFKPQPEVEPQVEPQDDDELEPVDPPAEPAQHAPVDHPKPTRKRAGESAAA